MLSICYETNATTEDKPTKLPMLETKPHQPMRLNPANTCVLDTISRYSHLPPQSSLHPLLIEDQRSSISASDFLGNTTVAVKQVMCSSSLL